MYPAFNQIVSEIARMRFRSNGAFGVPLVIRMPYGGGVHGALYHSQSNEAYFTATVGLKVVAPGTPADAYGLLKAAIRDPDPVMFFEHKKTYRLFKADVPDNGDGLVPIGPAVGGSRRAPICRSSATATCATAHWRPPKTLATQDGIQAEVVDLRTLRPLDTDTILASVARTGRALVVHEANGFGGFGGEIAAVIAERRLRTPRRAGHPTHRSRGARRPVRPQPGGLVHGQPRAHRRSRASARRVLIG